MQNQNLNLNCHLIFYTTSLSSRHLSSSDSLSQVTITSSSSTSSSPNKYTMHTGKWLPDENKRFLEGVAKYGANWKKIQSNIRTRTTTQARSHAQKIILKLKHKQILNIPLWVNTIQELFAFIKQFPHKEYIQLYNAILSIANEDLKRVNKKQKIMNSKGKEMILNEENNDIQIEECDATEDSNISEIHNVDFEGKNKEEMMLNNKKGRELFCILKNNSDEDVKELSEDTENESKSNMNGNNIKNHCDNRYINGIPNFYGDIVFENDISKNKEFIVRF